MIKRMAKLGLALSLLSAACGTHDQPEREAREQTNASEDFAGFEARIARLSDRTELRDEIVALVGAVQGAEIDDETRDRLAVIEARVDVLSGLVYAVDTPEGAQLKFYEPQLGHLTAVLAGAPELAQRYQLGDLSPVELFRQAKPGQTVPTVLQEATDRQRELALRAAAQRAQTSAEAAPVEVALTPAFEPAARDANKHFSTTHAFMTERDWQGHCFPNLAPCFANLTGARTAQVRSTQGVNWLYVLNQADPNGQALGRMLIATFNANFPPGSTVQDKFFLFPPPQIGPIMSVVGGMVQVSTAGPTFEEFPCSFPAACGGVFRQPLMDHTANFVAGPNAKWHLSTQGTTGVFLPHGVQAGNVLQL